jgi:hypothetical protein
LSTRESVRGGRFLSKSVFDGSIKNYARYERAAAGNIAQIATLFAIGTCDFVNAESSMPAFFISLNQKSGWRFHE